MMLLAAFSLAMLLLAAFFSGVEAAYFAANKFQLALRESAGDRTGQRLARLFASPERFLNTVLIGYNLALVLYAVAALYALRPLLLQTLVEQPASLLSLQAVLTTALALVLVEYLPKALFRRDPLRALEASSAPLLFLFRLIGPLSRAATALTRFFLYKLMRVPKAGPDSFTKEDLHRYISDWAEGTETSATTDLDAEMFRNALYFNETTVREFMVPRTEIEAVDVTATLEEIHEKFVETELSRILVYEETLDQVLGYIHSSALLLQPQPNDLRSVLQAMLIVPETMSADMLLREFNTRRMSVAVVVDEFGGTSGLVTLEDLVEVVFGEIDDEHDEEADEDLVMERLTEQSWIISGRVSVEEANEEFDLQLPEDEGGYNTLGGLFLHVAERIPEEGDSVQVGPYCLTVLRTSRNRIETLRVERSETAESNA